jgi:hypothetical protein
MSCYYAQFPLPELNADSTPCEQIWHDFLGFMRSGAL